MAATSFRVCGRPELLSRPYSQFGREYRVLDQAHRILRRTFSDPECSHRPDTGLFRALRVFRTRSLQLNIPSLRLGSSVAPTRILLPVCRLRPVSWGLDPKLFDVARVHPNTQKLLFSVSLRSREKVRRSRLF